MFKIFGSLSNISWGIWAIFGVTNVIGITSVPWEYLLTPMIISGVMLAILIVGIAKDRDVLDKNLSDESLVEMLEKRGYKVTKDNKGEQ